jgi:hypothetical protein
MELEEEDDKWIERPLETPSSLSLGNIRQREIRKAWSFLPIFRYWTMGYNQTALSRCFDLIPADIGFLLQKILEKVEEDMTNRIMHLKEVTRMCKQSSTEMNSDEVYHISEQSLWDGDETCPHMTIRYDPVSQHRKNVQVNKKMANIVGVHIEEYLARYAAYDIGIPMPFEDFICIMMDDVLSIPVNKKEIYHRLIATSGCNQAALVVSTVVKTFNAAGEITQAARLKTFAADSIRTKPDIPAVFGMTGATNVQGGQPRGV